MNTESKTEQLVKKLIINTQNGKLKWQVYEAPSALNQETEQSVPLFLMTEYKNKNIGVYDRRTKQFYDELEYYWSEGIGLCIVDDQHRVVWEANEYFPALLDLFNEVREKAAGLDDILDGLL